MKRSNTKVEFVMDWWKSMGTTSKMDAPIDVTYQKMSMVALKWLSGVHVKLTNSNGWRAFVPALQKVCEWSAGWLPVCPGNLCDCRLLVWRFAFWTASVSYLVDPASGICLFQRLSHACLSMRWSKVKPRIAHYNSRCFLDLFSTWITVVILELIHATEPRTFVTGAFIRTKPSGFGRPLVTLNNWADRMGLPRRQIFQVSALSGLVGRLCDDLACNG